MAPEVVLTSGYGTAVDWWGLGVTAFVLLTGQQPFSRTVNGVVDDPLTVMKRIIDPLWKVSYPFYMTPDATDLVSRLLERRPAKRIGNLLGRASDIKQHPWFDGFSWDDLETKKMSPPACILSKAFARVRNKRIQDLEEDLALLAREAKAAEGAAGSKSKEEEEMAQRIFKDF